MSDRGARAEDGKPQEEYLLGTMFDASRVVERTLSTGTVIRLRVEELGGGRVMVHRAFRLRRGESNWQRWPDVEGARDGRELLLERCVAVEPDGTG